MQCSGTTHNGLNMPFQRTCAPYLLAYSDHTSDSQKDISIYLWGVANTLYFTLLLRIISTQKRPFSLLKKSNKMYDFTDLQNVIIMYSTHTHTRAHTHTHTHTHTNTLCQHTYPLVQPTKHTQTLEKYSKKGVC